MRFKIQFSYYISTQIEVRVNSIVKWQFYQSFANLRTSQSHPNLDFRWNQRNCEFWEVEDRIFTDQVIIRNYNRRRHVNRFCGNILLWSRWWVDDSLRRRDNKSRLIVLDEDINFGLRNNVIDLVIRIKFKIIFILDCKLCIPLNYFLIDQLLLNFLSQFFDSVGLRVNFNLFWS